MIIQTKSKREGTKIDQFKDTKLVNFFRLARIYFQNIASTDTLIASKIITMMAKCRELAFVTSSVESDAGKGW